MNSLKITLWNGDTLTIPYVKSKYNLKSINHHMKLLLKNIDEQNIDKEKVI